MDALLDPFLGNDLPFPDDVIQEFLNLVAQAHVAADGDAFQYLETLIRELEIGLVESDAEFGEDAGNAPRSPVRFAARVF